MPLHTRFSAVALGMLLAGTASHAQLSATSSAVTSAVAGTGGASVSMASSSLRAALTPLVATSSAAPLPLADGPQTVAASAALTGGAVTAIQGAASNLSQGAGTGSAQSSGSARALLPQTTVQGGVPGDRQVVPFDNGLAIVSLPWAQVSAGARSQAQAVLSSGTNGAALLSGGAAATVNHSVNVSLTITPITATGIQDVAVVTPSNQSQNTVQPTVQSQSGSGQVVLPGSPVAADATSASTATGGGSAIKAVE